MARRALKFTSWTSVALAASGFYLYNNKYLDPNDFGAVRVGRAVATVGFSHFVGREELQYYLKVNIHIAVDTLVTHMWRYTCTLTCAKLFLYSVQAHRYMPHAPLFLYVQPLPSWSLIERDYTGSLF